MAAKKSIHSFDKDEEVEYGEPVQFIAGGRTWTVQPKKVPAGIVAGFLRAINEGENSGAVIEYFDNMIHFFMYLLGVEEGTAFAAMLSGTGVEDKNVVDISTAIEIGAWVLEQISERPM